MKFSDFLFVFIGSGVGGCLRYFISKVLVTSGSFPFATLLINILACLLAGLLVVRFETNFIHQPEYRLLLLIGFCGGFSTFSAFGLETFELIQKGNVMSALAYVGISVGAGLASVATAIKLNA